jgi:hypothetical protein
MSPRRTTLRGLAFRACVFLALGAIINVAVAWGCALWSVQEVWVADTPIEPPRRWPAYLERIGWPEPTAAVRREGMGVGVTVIEITGGDAEAGYRRTDPADKVFVSLEVRRFGLPLQSLQWERHGIHAGPRSREMASEAWSAAGWRRGINVSQMTGAVGGGLYRALPLTPVLPGFVLNTLLYAAILWAPIVGLPACRRRLRHRRGQCPACAYPVGVSPVCTECGEAVVPIKDKQGT